jgi:hypothetical protein
MSWDGFLETPIGTFEYEYRQAFEKCDAARIQFKIALEKISEAEEQLRQAKARLELKRSLR